MTLRKKILIVIGLTLVGLIVILYVTSGILLMERFIELKELILVLLTISIISGLMIMLFVEKHVLSRLSRLSKTARSLDVGGDLAVSLPIAGKDELSNLKDVIDGMLGALRKSHDELELRVQERTAELAKINETLQTQIAKRKDTEKELKHSVGKLRKAMGEIVHVVALTIEVRDPYTAGHQRHVADLARTIAKEMGLPEDQINGTYMAGLIHDMGKISVPAEILSKPSILGENEFSIIRTHPQVGYQILKEIEFPWPIAQIVFQHHERMDGSGYPQGLSSKDILLEAQILAVSDVVDAMSHHRPYRPAFGIDEALKEVSQNAGVIYASKAVDVCVKLFTKKKFNFK